MSFIFRNRDIGRKSCAYLSRYLGLPIYTSHGHRYDIETETLVPAELPSDAEYVIRWGCSGHLPNGPKIINKTTALAYTIDKRGSRKKFADAGLAPKTWLSLDAYMMDQGSELTPVVIRPSFHARGQNLFLCRTYAEARAAVSGLPEYYVSEYIAKEHEYRVFVVSGRVVAAVEKVPVDRSEVAWGCVDEGQFAYINWNEWSIPIMDNAVRTTLMAGLDFSAVDIMTRGSGADMGVYCLEINTAPGITPYYGDCYGKGVKYILDNGRDTIPLGTTGDWKSYIHPNVSSQAR